MSAYKLAIANINSSTVMNGASAIPHHS